MSACSVEGAVSGPRELGNSSWMPSLEKQESEIPHHQASSETLCPMVPVGNQPSLCLLCTHPELLPSLSHVYPISPTTHTHTKSWFEEERGLLLSFSTLGRWKSWRRTCNDRGP